jgi:selenocysteine-specific translation elongation factor
VSKGDRVLALPSGRRTRIHSLVAFDGERENATAGDSITVTLDDEIDLSRGDVLVSELAPPIESRHVRASIVWMHREPLDPDCLYLIKHTTRTVRARVARVLHRVDIETLQPAGAGNLRLNDIAAVEVETTLPVWFDAYRVNRTMGGFILIDPISNATVAAGMIEGAVPQVTANRAQKVQERVSSAERRERFGHHPAAVWINDERLAEQVERALFSDGWLVQLISSSDCRSADLPTVARVLRRMGAIGVFSSAEPEASQEHVVRDVFGENAFFTAGGQREATAVESILSALRQWRERRPEQNSEKGKGMIYD